MFNIAVVNESTAFNNSDMPALVNALQIQVSRDFAPVWGVDAKLSQNTAVPANAWALVLLDNADQAGALGYHDLTANGLPLGKVFVKTTLADGGLVSVTASHELLEMLADPDINLSAEVQDRSGHRLYAQEVCDACEDDQFGYQIDGVTVSDFVYPTWFETFRLPGEQFDFQKKITAPFQLLTGGYISVMNLRRGTGWIQLTADDAKAVKKSRAPVGSRRERRRTLREHWQRSLR